MKLAVSDFVYAEEVAKVYPHVADLSGSVAKGHPRERIEG